MSNLISTKAPYVHLSAMTESEITNFGWSLEISNDFTKVRFLRGKKMQETRNAFDEFAAALQFPYYFGQNWNALKECLADMEWLPAKSYIFIITNSDYFLKTDDTELQVFFKVWSMVVSELQDRVDVYNEKKLPPISLHLIFQYREMKRQLMKDKLFKMEIPFDEI